MAVATRAATCDWSTWWVGSRTQWNVTKDFYMGVDVMYSKLQSADALQSVSTLGALVAIGECGHPFRRPIRTTGSSASACTAISIPDRVHSDLTKCKALGG